jgi:deoxyribonuclease IV
MEKKDTNPLLGAHISSAGGLEQVFARAKPIGCTTLQFFTKNNRQWHTKELTPEQINAFTKEYRNSSLQPLIAHASYLINNSSTDNDLAQKSYDALCDELLRCEQLGVPQLVLHPGNCSTGTKEICLDQLISSIDKALSTTSTALALEIMAGQGSAICCSFEELGYVYKKLHLHHKNKIRICFDTCHAFAAGYDFRTKKTYDALWERFDDLIGIKAIGVIHLNDSKKDLGSRIDRHENIGKGLLGLEPFRFIMNDPLFKTTPKILETPPGDLTTYALEIQLLRNLIEK